MFLLRNYSSGSGNNIVVLMSKYKKLTFLYLKKCITILLKIQRGGQTSKLENKL